jgi:hypothetical protein
MRLYVIGNLDRTEFRDYFFVSRKDIPFHELEDDERVYKLKIVPEMKVQPDVQYIGFLATLYVPLLPNETLGLWNEAYRYCPVDDVYVEDLILQS